MKFKNTVFTVVQSTLFTRWRQLFLILILASCQTSNDSPKPKPKDYLIGEWQSKDSLKNKYRFRTMDSGQVYFNGKWNAMVWKYKSSQTIDLGWFGRSSTYWIFDLGKDSFNLFTISGGKVPYYRK